MEHPTVPISIQVGNWRTAEVQLLEADSTVIDLTGATGYIVWNDPAGLKYKVALNLGRAPGHSSNSALEATQGWCWATFKGINVPGEWAEQVQAVLPSGSEPLKAGVTPFLVEDNLAAP